MARPRGFNTYLEWDRGFRGWLVVWFVTAVLGLIHRMAALRGDSLKMVLGKLGWWRVASGVVLPLAWALYWMRSKRVQNTYVMVSAAHDTDMVT